MAGLYIHVPFCHSKCAYCDFYSMPRCTDIDAFARAIPIEYEARKHEIASSPLRTIYIGGGTPSILPIASLQAITSTLPKHNVTEFTIEANPEDVTSTAVAAWRDLGINRISMGVQSLDDMQLLAIGRRHSADDAIKAVNAMTKAGIDNFNLDLIYGLPAQDLQSWEKSLEGIIALRPKHISAYMLSYEHGTRLYAQQKKGEIAAADDELLIDMYTMLCDHAREAGYVHYEISNFALPGYEAQHNSAYWDGTPYLGLGPSAHSYDGNIRRINAPNLKKYLLAFQNPTLNTHDFCSIDPEDDDNRFNDLLMTRLRTAKGLPLALVPEPYATVLHAEAAKHISKGNLVITHDCLCIPENKWIISDSIISDLMVVS